MKTPAELKYTKNDEWIRVEGDSGTIGITDYAQDQLSDIVFVEFLVDEGETIDQGDVFATIESVKAAADIYSPASGTVKELNEDLSDSPEMINTDPYGEAWLATITLTEPSEIDELLDSDAYNNLEH